MFWLFSIFWHPSIHVGHWVTQGLFFVMSFYWGFTCLPSGSRSKFHTHWIVFQHICLWVMILFHNLSCFLRVRDSSVFMAIIQYKPTKCTFPKLIFHEPYQPPRPQYITHSSTYLLTYLLTYSLVQSPSWEASWFAASQEIPRVSRNPNVHYCTDKRPPPVSILGQTNPVHTHTFQLLEINPNIHPSMPRSPQWSLSLRFLPTRLLILMHVTRTVP